MNNKVLIIEDEKKIARFLELELAHEGYDVDIAYEGRDGLIKFEQNEYDLILLDILLPGLNGLEICRRIRKEASIPIIIVSAKDETTDKVCGLDIGADDYLTKPFAIEELLARMRVHLRKLQKSNPGDNKLKIADLMMNLDTHEVFRGDQKVFLTNQEYELLKYLLENKKIVLTRDQIGSKVWGYDFEDNTNVVDVYISYLRRKVDQSGKVKLIHTIRGSDNFEGIDILRQMYLPVLEQSFTPPPELPRPRGFKPPVLVETSLTSAEMIKYASNVFLALKISYINEIGGLCEKTGADIKEVAYGMGLDPRIGSRFLNAGIGWGGSCFPKDTLALMALGAAYDYSMPIIDAACAVNKRQRQVVIKKLESQLGDLSGRTVGILGLAFKPGTDDLRDSPAQDIIKLLVERGVRVKAHDPVAVPSARKLLAEYQVEYGVNPYQTACGCDALVLITEWEEYLKLDFLKLRSVMNTPILIDGRNFLNPAELNAVGFLYEGVGIGDACLGNGRGGVYRESPSGQAS